LSAYYRAILQLREDHFTGWDPERIKLFVERNPRTRDLLEEIRGLKAGGRRVNTALYARRLATILGLDIEDANAYFAAAGIL
jgi:hypothetical protein